MIPGAVAADAHSGIPAMLGVPAFDRREAPLVDQVLKVVQAKALEFDRRLAFRHWRVIGLLRGVAQGRSARDE
jgi:hypothetical protein